jgi:hypothetical protein
VGWWGGGEMAQTMYTHVSKCKSHEMRIENKIHVQQLL